MRRRRRPHRRRRGLSRCSQADGDRFLFFGRPGMVSVIPLLEQRTVNAQWYCEVCLPLLFQKLNDSRPKRGLRGILLHRENAPARTTVRPISFLGQTIVQLFHQPAYSHCLNPNVLFLFPKIKSKLKGVRFERAESALHAFKSYVLSTPRKTGITVLIIGLLGCNVVSLLMDVHLKRCK